MECNISLLTLSRNMSLSSAYYIQSLGLQPHPEGGYFKETYRSEMTLTHKEFESARNVCTGIYFMLVEGNFSAFHRIKSDEMWHFYTGDALNIYVIHPSGEFEVIKLGLALDKGQLPQAVVPAGCWFASRVADGGSFSLVGCTVAPGFDFNDFEMAKRGDLNAVFPQHQDIIHELTRST